MYTNWGGLRSAHVGRIQNEIPMQIGQITRRSLLVEWEITYDQELRRTVEPLRCGVPAQNRRPPRFSGCFAPRTGPLPFSRAKCLFRSSSLSSSSLDGSVAFPLFIFFGAGRGDEDCGWGDCLALDRSRDFGGGD